MNKGPENVFEFIRVSFGSHVGEPVFDLLIDIKRVAPRVNDKTAGIGA